MKKILAILLSVAMVASLAACNSENGDAAGGTTTTPAGDNSGDKTEDNKDNTGDNNGDDTDDTTTTEAEAPPVEAEEFDYEPLLHFGFETADGFDKVYEDIYDESTWEITEHMAPSDHEVMIAEGGVSGNALYLDGDYGLEFDMVAIDDDSYTISFWVYAERLGTFTPTFQLGRNIGTINPDATTTWMNFTQMTFDGTFFPGVWNKNDSIPAENADGYVWPWVGPGTDTIKGKGEWCMVTVVVDGNRYTCLDDNGDRIGMQFYLNGELVWDANAENQWYQGAAPEIFKSSDDLQGLIGINYWDGAFKGFLDEFYVFDEPFTAGEVMALYQMGDPTAEPVAPSHS